MKKSILRDITVAIALVVPVFSGVVYAQEPQETNTTNKVNVSAEYKESAENVTKLRVAATKPAKLDEAKKKVCEQKTKVIEQHSVKLLTHVEKKVEVFDNIADKVKKFAETREAKPVDYEALLERLVVKRAAALEAGAGIKTASAGFSCNGENPKGQGSLIVGESKLGRSALKEYQTAVKDLLVGVKSANGGN